MLKLAVKQALKAGQRPTATRLPCLMPKCSLIAGSKPRIYEGRWQPDLLCACEVGTGRNVEAGARRCDLRAARARVALHRLYHRLRVNTVDSGPHHPTPLESTLRHPLRPIWQPYGTHAMHPTLGGSYKTAACKRHRRQTRLCASPDRAGRRSCQTSGRRRLSHSQRRSHYQCCCTLRSEFKALHSRDESALHDS